MAVLNRGSDYDQLEMGRGEGESGEIVGEIVSRTASSRGGLGPAFDLSRARDQIVARFARAREVSPRRAASLIYSPEMGGWRVFEVFSDSPVPTKTPLDVSDPDDPRQVESAYHAYLERARSADALTAA